MMNDAVEQARIALTNNTPHSMSLLAESIQQGASCFHQWGLVSETLEQHMKLLYAHGALAVKPTGSGNGGFVISLWEQPPTTALPLKMIEL